jgi:CDP-2,3-bis-(O-geranylgeranyl)-sn-glycerol synthase
VGVATMDLSSLLNETLQLFILILPAMVANGSPVVVVRRIKHRHPIDRGIVWRDGRRLLGDGKTIEGFFAGLAAAVIMGVIEAVFLRDPNLIPLSFLAGLGALIGDIVGSFIKRRAGLESGEHAPLLDQLDFYVGALLALWLAGSHFSLTAATVLAPIVYGLHRLTNWLAYKAGLKSVPY